MESLPRLTTAKNAVRAVQHLTRQFLISGSIAARLELKKNTVPPMEAQRPVNSRDNAQWCGNSRQFSRIICSDQERSDGRAESPEPRIPSKGGGFLKVRWDSWRVMREHGIASIAMCARHTTNCGMRCLETLIGRRRGRGRSAPLPIGACIAKDKPSGQAWKAARVCLATVDWTDEHSLYSRSLLATASSQL